ncbi:MAG: GMC family oxidoreductase [Anaerolineae bacterium]|nr:GMC family oxidoreductase [Anaerolineae bacterium]
MIYVVGSGPAGVSCAMALVNQGLEVTMLDAGIELEPERQQILQRMRASKREDWDAASLGMLTGRTSANINGIPVKYVYGSDYPYREADRYIPIEGKHVVGSPSLARGGFSNAWGATSLPYLSSDIADWPISAADLAPHYEAVLSFVPLSATRDALAATFPPYSNAFNPLRPGRQASAFLKDLNYSHDPLRKAGIAFGQSRLAVRAETTGDGPGCVYCGLCMYGCPYGLIYNSSSTVARLQRTNNFHYVKDVVVQKVVEEKGQVQILVQSRLNQEKLTFAGARVYLACGVWSTTKILLESLEAYGHPVTMKDSQYFLFPLLRYRKAGDVVKEDLYTLAQVFLDITDERLGGNTVHLEVCTYNDLYLRAIKGILGPTYPLFRWPVGEFLGRLLIIQGFLHSNVSRAISVRLQPSNAGSTSRLVLEALPNERTRQAIRGVLAKLFAHRRYTKAVPLPIPLHIAEPGRSFHSGGTFPMRSKPSDYESDVLGRPRGFERVHVVDATTFPSIPATTITLSLMANAHRIAAAYHQT